MDEAFGLSSGSTGGELGDGGASSKGDCNVEVDVKFLGGLNVGWERVDVILSGVRDG